MARTTRRLVEPAWRGSPVPVKVSEVEFRRRRYPYGHDSSLDRGVWRVRARRRTIEVLRSCMEFDELVFDRDRSTGGRLTH